MDAGEEMEKSTLQGPGVLGSQPVGGHIGWPPRRSRPTGVPGTREDFIEIAWVKLTQD